MSNATILKAAPTLVAMTFVVMVTTQVSAQIVHDDLNLRIHTRHFGDQATDWSREHCEDPNECDIQIKIRDGQRFVIVNGDTVDTNELFEDDGWDRLDGLMPKLEGFTNRFIRDDLGRHGFAFFSGDDLDFTWSTDATLKKMELRARQLAEEARHAEGAQRTELEARLQEKLGELFDYKLDRQQRRIEETQEKLADMQERYRDRESARDEIIEQRRRHLLGQGRHMEW